jgi:hypothetical protein
MNFILFTIFISYFLLKAYENILFPSFTNNSFIELSHHIDISDFSIELELKSSKANGLLFFASQFIDGSGDFIALIIRENSIEMRIDGAKEILEVFTLPTPIELDKFHRLFIKKKDSLLFMQLDDTMPYQEQILHGSFSLRNNIILGRIFNLPRFSKK